ncbi:MAG: preprotein translocase subunit SecY [Chloroflexi bacterium]|nr:preprotein translocase subunit SecY [Chloroflexota bacterium]
MLQAVVNALKIAEVRKKILFTMMMLVIFRFIAAIPVPGVDTAELDRLFNGQLPLSDLANFLNLLSGGALRQFSVAAMGVYPYITAQIIMQLLIPLIPALEQLSKEGEQGRNRIQRYQYFLTVPLAYLQGYGQIKSLINSGINLFGTLNFSITENFFQTFSILTIMVAGSMFLVWMGELIDERGIGNGLSMIIFGGIVTALPSMVYQAITTSSSGNNVIGGILLLIVTLATVVGIVLITEGQRRIPVQYAKRVRGNKVYGGQSSHLPLKVNMAGMIPLIFAQSILIFPSTVASYFWNPNGSGFFNGVANFFVNSFGPNGLAFTLAMFVLVLLFTYFYALVMFNQQNLPEMLQRNGGFIPGIRPGRNTEVYLTKVLNRITLIGAVGLAVVAALPYFVQQITGLQIGFSSTGLLIVVGVAVDTMRQLEAQMMMRNYEGFISR